MRFPSVRPPKPLLPAETERRLTSRQLEVLDELEALMADDGFAELTMAEIASRVNCSLRTLYGIVPSKDELVLTLVDRKAHRIGRAAIEALDASLSPLDALRVYLRAVNQLVQPTTAVFFRDFARVPGAKRLIDAHEAYVVAITENLLDRAVAEGQVRPVDTAAFAHVMGSLGRELSQPEVLASLQGTPTETANAVTEVILRGLAAA